VASIIMMHDAMPLMQAVLDLEAAEVVTVKRHRIPVPSPLETVDEVLHDDSRSETTEMLLAVIGEHTSMARCKIRSMCLGRRIIGHKKPTIKMVICECSFN
jgi:hypothetical protein